MLAEDCRRQVSEGVVRAFLVVGEEPLVGDVADLVERGEEVGIEHFMAEAPVEAFDVGVLGGSTFLKRIVCQSIAKASSSSNRPHKSLPAPVISFKVSKACTLPMIPSSGATTPVCAHVSVTAALSW